MQGCRQHRIAFLQGPAALAAEEVSQISDVCAEAARRKLQSMSSREVRRQYCVQIKLLLLQTLQERVLLELPRGGAQGLMLYQGNSLDAADVRTAAMSKVQVFY